MENRVTDVEQAIVERNITLGVDLIALRNARAWSWGHPESKESMPEASVLFPAIARSSLRNYLLRAAISALGSAGCGRR
jgi:hypothetical protein